MNSNDLDSLFKKPETIKEKLEDIVYNFLYYYPDKIKQFFLSFGLFFKNIIKYRKILWTDYDWDFGYLDSIILTKLEKMADYFRISRIAVNNELRYEKINKTIQVGKIAFDQYDFGEIPPKVNLRNFRRFCSTKKEYDAMIKFLETREEKYRGYILEEMRQRKARQIFYDMIKNYEEDWWD